MLISRLAGLVLPASSKYLIDDVVTGRRPDLLLPIAFAAGAAVPVVPYLFGGGGLIFTLSLGFSLIALFAVGAGVSLITGRGLLFSGARQVLIGAAAAAVTFGVGRLIGFSVS